ncbi:CIC family chloride channel protein [Wenyingzhuangia heitensis]|uniref:CIC family chloride channel protein n=1 Tax=Wenyingzhuangia heitensis TaxID=1487859 RepID=A0ABX0UCW2_9FLAO|nr:chloride channel protein [Wenyingzhuangia heitensis]NIJ45381.1 CIC family chloride channel protein [Wenyingzhuangia heitensis]
MRKKVIRKGYYNLILNSFWVGILATLLGITLKKGTAYFEENIIEKTEHISFLYFFLPSIGITLIYFIRKYFFKGKQNKGIKEIFNTLEDRKDELPFYKIPSHYINGFLTVVFGGSTGIEVSTVVATAAVGSTIYKKEKVANAYKTELICAGVAAGITTLFGSPIAGFLFAIEVISRKINKTLFLSCAISISIAQIFVALFDRQKLFNFEVFTWNYQAIPYMILLSIIAAIIAVFFTKSVIFIKAKFEKIKNNFIRVNTGALLLGLAIFIFPAFYGDSYHAIPELLTHQEYKTLSVGFMLSLIAFVFFKPIVASLTLGAGGDGGVFAPSIVTGAVLGIFVALFCNHFFNSQLIVLNFALIGAAAMLSAAIHAPLTALFLTCNIVDNGFALFIPLLIGVYIAKYIALFLCDYTVYTYQKRNKKLTIQLK